MKRSLILSGFLVVSVISMYGMEGLASATSRHPYYCWGPGVEEKDVVDSRASTQVCPEDTYTELPTDREFAWRESHPERGRIPQFASPEQNADAIEADKEERAATGEGTQSDYDPLSAFIQQIRGGDSLRGGEQGVWHDMRRMHRFMQQLEVLRAATAKKICSNFNEVCDPNQLSAEGIYPLEYAITVLKDWETVSALLRLGANPNPSVRLSPLYHAVYFRLPGIVATLLDYGANYSKKSPNGFTPVDLVRYLLKNSFADAKQREALRQIQEILQAQEKPANKRRHSLALPTLRRNGKK